MTIAAAEARRWLGATYPNPPVGAVALDANGRIIAVAAHERAGQPHAEASLLEKCRALGTVAQIHTLAVTLEPCNHHGRTPPCAEAIIAAGIKHVAIGVSDPNPAVKGGGIGKLRAAGIEVTEGVEIALCQQLIYAFAHKGKTGLPWITVKRAFDKDGSMIPPLGKKVFTSERSLRFAHRLRKRADAILTGSGTILSDDPLFTVRRVPDHYKVTRLLAVLDRRRRVPEVWLDRAAAHGFQPVVYDDLDDVITDMAGRGICEILVEAGPLLSAAVLASEKWAMDVVVQQSSSDSINTRFNPAITLPFPADNWRWRDMLPEEYEAV